jgi:hypothetical protein
VTATLVEARGPRTTSWRRGPCAVPFTVAGQPLCGAAPEAAARAAGVASGAPAFLATALVPRGGAR